MAKLLERLPFINLWKWSDGNEYTIEEDTTVLTPELAESDESTNRAYAERYNQPKKGNGGKGKGQQFREETKVEKGKLNKEQVKTTTRTENSSEREIVD